VSTVADLTKQRPEQGEVVLDAVDVHKTYRGRGLRRTVGKPAVDGVGLQVRRGETVGVVGESGSGKSTLARLLVGLLRPDSGTITVSGEPLPTKGGAALRAFRAKVQMVFQDPYGSLDPHRRIRSTLLEPLVVQGIGDGASRTKRINELMDLVGLSRQMLDRHPSELSGGQRQRIAIARALAGRPGVLVCDEPVSALDVSTQAQVVNLLKDLQEELQLAMVFITHDMSVVRNISHRLAVMHAGKVVETGETEQVLADPQDDYTRTLLSAVPGRNLHAVRESGTAAH
jgi:peptide/nickel transport system ATP-binding protein